MPDSDRNSASAADDGNYVVVARRYRPRGFEELVGQQHVARALRNAIETSRVGHAYLFTGARGVGKTSTARIFAKALNDAQGPTATPDNDSDVAHAIDSGEDVDVIEIDGASNRGIDEIRSLRANIGIRPSRSRYKIYIIDEVHMLTQAAFNALLKTLEEPPEHVKFIFCTTDPEKIPITVLSRCQRFDFAPVEVQKIVERLRLIVDGESAEADDDALELIARRATGSMRDSQSLLEQVLSFSNGKLTADQVHTMLGTADDERLHALAEALADRDAASALRQMDAGIDAGVDAGRLAEQLLGYFRDLMAVTVGCDAGLLRHTSAALHQPLKELGEKWGLQTVLAVVGLIDQTLVRIRHSVYSRVLLEATLIQICNLPDLQQISDLAEAAKGMGATRGSQGAKKKKPSVAPRNSSAFSSGSPAETGSKPSPPPQVAASQAIHRGAESIPNGPHLDASTPPSDSTNAAAAQASTSESRASSTMPIATTTPAGGSPESLVPGSLVPGSLVPGAKQAATVVDSEIPTGSSPVETASWNQPHAERVWKETLGRLESMTESFARVVQNVQAEGEQTLRLTFSHDGGLAKRRCELPEHRTALSDAVSSAAGRAITLEYDIAPAPAQPRVVETAVAKPSRMQRMREIESNALVQSCLELFEAEIVRIEKPK